MDKEDLDLIVPLRGMSTTTVVNKRDSALILLDILESSSSASSLAQASPSTTNTTNTRGGNNSNNRLSKFFPSSLSNSSSTSLAAPTSPSSAKESLVLQEEEEEDGVDVKEIFDKIVKTGHLAAARSYRSMKYLNCFPGSLLVTWLVAKKFSPTREHAAYIGQRMVDEGLIYHVEHDQPFQDGQSLFRLANSELLTLQRMMRDPVVGFMDEKKHKNSKRISLTMTRKKEVDKLSYFTGKQMVDWLMTYDPDLGTRAKAAKIGQDLLNEYLICKKGLEKQGGDGIIDPKKNMKSIAEKAVFEDSDSAKYFFVRENVSVRSLIAASKKDWIWYRSNKGKWVKGYFVLMDFQNRLFYFENEESFHPLGSFFLKETLVRVVDDSMFSRPNCCQIQTPDRSFFLSWDSSDAREEWINALSQLSSEQVAYEAESERGRQQITFRFRLEEARELLPAQYYCVISVGDTAVARTHVSQKSSTPEWHEEYFFDDFTIHENITVTVFMKVPKPFPDNEVAHFKIDCMKLQPSQEVNEWVNLITPLTGVTTMGVKKPKPALKILYTMEEELIIPLMHYSKLIGLLNENMRIASYILTQVPLNDLDQTSLSVVKIYETQQKAQDFAFLLIEKEFYDSPSHNVLFRDNSSAAKVIVSYMNLIGFQYLVHTLHSPLKRFIEFCTNSSQAQSVGSPDISRASTSSTSSASSLNSAASEEPNSINNCDDVFLAALNDLWSAIFDSHSIFPKELRLFFMKLQEELEKKYPAESSEEHAKLKYLIPNGFVFLRFICPAIVSPTKFGLMKDQPDLDTIKLLTKAARMLQLLANLKQDSTILKGNPDHEKFITDNIPKMKEFVNNTTNPKEDSASTPVNVDLEREMSFFYQYLVQFRTQLMENLDVETKKKLAKVFEEVSNVYYDRWKGRAARYMYQAPLSSN